MGLINNNTLGRKKYDAGNINNDERKENYMIFFL